MIKIVHVIMVMRVRIEKYLFFEVICYSGIKSFNVVNNI